MIEDRIKGHIELYAAPYHEGDILKKYCDCEKAEQAAAECLRENGIHILTEEAADEMPGTWG